MEPRSAANRLALRLIESRWHGRSPRWLRRWAFNQTNLVQRVAVNRRKYADILERLDG